MRLNSHDEWSPLETVVVGTVDGFSPGVDVAEPTPGVIDRAAGIAREAFPQWYLDEVAEDLDGLCAIFRQAGVTVLRPKWTEAVAHFQTPNWAASGYDIYNVRDLHIVFGNTLVASAPSSRFRLFESYALRELFYEHFFAEGFRWITAPPPKLRGRYVHEVQQQPTAVQKGEDALHKKLSHGLSEVFHYLDDDEIVFDAANIIRLGADVLFLVSSTGNHKAVKWLADVLGPEYRVHETHTYRSSHLDSTILPLRPGTVLLNGARVTDETCPAVLRSWDRLYFTDVAPVPEDEVAFHQKVRRPVFEKLKAMGVESSLNHISSPWAGLNVLSLEQRKFTAIPVRMRHCYSMLGGLHCTTRDVVRRSA
jgi:N-dimethylarginine dimethylaminohydrolase